MKNVRDEKWYDEHWRTDDGLHIVRIILGHGGDNRENPGISGFVAVSNPVGVVDKIWTFARSLDESKPLPGE